MTDCRGSCVVSTCPLCQSTVRVAMVSQLADVDTRRARLPWVIDPRYGLESRVAPAEVLADILRRSMK